MTLDQLYKGQSHLQWVCAAPPTLTVVVEWLVWVKCALSVSVNGWWCSIWVRYRRLPGQVESNFSFHLAFLEQQVQ